jgi:hypothetical protein
MAGSPVPVLTTAELLACFHLLAHDLPARIDVNRARAVGGLGQVESDGDFYVVDGTGNSASTGEAVLRNTGFVLEPGVWADVTLTINFPAQTWTFSVNSVPYQAPGWLGFRGQPTRLDEIQFVNEIAAPDGSYLDAVVLQTVPAPASVVLLGLGLLAVGAVERVARRRCLSAS